MANLHALSGVEEESSLWESEGTPSSAPVQTGGMREFLSRSWSTRCASEGITSPVTHLGSAQSLGDSCYDLGRVCLSSQLKPEYMFDSYCPPSDLSPLIPIGSQRYAVCESLGAESCHSTPKELKKLKTWLWMKQEQPYALTDGRCLYIEWLERTFGCLKRRIKPPPIRKWLKEGRKQKATLETSSVQALLSVASVAAVVAAATAQTIDLSSDSERNSKMALAVASAAALVATYCANFAEENGANQEAVAASVSSAGKLKLADDIIALTVSAASSLRAATHGSRSVRKSWSPCNMATSVGPSTYDDSEPDCFYDPDMLARGGHFLVRYADSKLHWRFVCVLAETHKQVILKLRSRCLAGAVVKTEKRVVFGISINVAAWPGRSLLHGGEDRGYFGLATSHGPLEFECTSEFDHRLWTTGISHLLFLTKQCAKAQTQEEAK